MKKLIPLAVLLLMLCGCTAKTYTPVLDTDVNCSGVYQTGDFSFTFSMEKSGGVLTFIPTSTQAQGMVLRCDGRQISFEQGGIKKVFERSAVDKTNPAVLLYEAFSYLENTPQPEAERKDKHFIYTGQTGAGSFSLIQSEDGRLLSLTVPAADISIAFDADM